MVDKKTVKLFVICDICFDEAEILPRLKLIV